MFGRMSARVRRLEEENRQLRVAVAEVAHVKLQVAEMRETLERLSEAQDVAFASAGQIAEVERTTNGEARLG